jgi:hypothetical protein
MTELLTYYLDKGIYKIHLTNVGYIGEIIYHINFKHYVFIPIENFYYKAIYLILIAQKLNKLNNYEVKNEINNTK